MDMKIILAVVAVVLVGFYILYTRVIRCRNKVQESMADIDVQLKKRYEKSIHLF